MLSDLPEWMLPQVFCVRTAAASFEEEELLSRESAMWWRETDPLEEAVMKTDRPQNLILLTSPACLSLWIILGSAEMALSVMSQPCRTLQFVYRVTLQVDKKVRLN